MKLYNADYARYYDSNNGNVDYRDFYYRSGSVKYNANSTRYSDWFNGTVYGHFIYDGLGSVSYNAFRAWLYFSASGNVDYSYSFYTGYSSVLQCDSSSVLLW